MRVTPEEAEAYRRAERQRVILGYTIQVARFLIRHWRISLPAFFLLVFLASFDFISLLMFAGSLWAAIKLGRGSSAPAPVQEAPEPGLPPHLVWLPQRWDEVAYETGLTRTVLVPPDRITSMVDRFHGLDSEYQEVPASPPIVGIFEATVGIGFEVQMFEGQELKDFERASEVMKNMFAADGVLGVRGVRLEQPVGTDIVKITLVIRDPLAKGRELTPTTLPAVPSLESVEVGQMEDGTPYRFLLGTSSVVGGVSGAGKSVLVSSLLAVLGQRDDVAIIGIDCKELLEFGVIEPRLSAVAGTQEDALPILEQVEEIRKARGAYLREAGYASMADHGYSRERPYIYVVVDEAMELFSPEDSTKEARERAARLQTLASRVARLGRAMGIYLLLSTQRPTVDAIPAQIRDNCSQKVALRCTTAEQAKAILGGDASVGAVHPTDIGHGQKGYAVVAREGQDPGLARAYFISTQTKREVAAATSSNAVPLASLV